MHDSSIALSRLLRTPPAPAAAPSPSDAEWRLGLPTLMGRLLALRELTTADAAALVPLLTAPEVARFMTPTPEAPNWFEAFVTATTQARRAGRYAGPVARLLLLVGLVAVIYGLERHLQELPSTTWVVYVVPVLLAPRLVPAPLAMIFIAAGSPA